MVVTDTAVVRSELTKILSSSVFANSPRMIRFLRYVVETTLEGHGGRIKEYVIALEVFEKSETYDPQADSTVRTEASKLRARLSRYYETEGRQDPVVISIPKEVTYRRSRIDGVERRRLLPRTGRFEPRRLRWFWSRPWLSQPASSGSPGHRLHRCPD